MTALTSEIKIEADRICEDSLYSAKGHWVAAELYHQVYFWLGVISTVSAAITAWFVGNLNEGDGKIILIFLALFSAISTGLLTFIEPQKKAFEHHSLGNRYKTISNNARLFKNTCHTMNEKEGMDAVGALQNAYNKINEESNLIIPALARRISKKRLQNGEHKYEVDNRKT